MIGQAILFPTLFSRVPENEPGRTLTFSAIIGLLQDLSENCIILVDEQKSITQEITKGLESWPADFRKQAISLLEFMAKKNRIVRLKSAELKNTGCCSGCLKGCSLGAHTYNEKLDPVIFVPNTCRECISKVNSKIDSCTLEHYPLSHFFRQQRASRTITLSDGDWTNIELADKLIKPLIRHASIFKIYDRLLIGSMWSSSDRSVTAQLKLSIPEHFLRTLDWLFGTISATTPKLPIEIYSALQTGSMDTPTLKAAQQAINDFRDDIKKRFDIQIAVFPKKESWFQGMPHGRYAMTNQFALLVERGFDLLWDDTQMQKRGFAKTDPRRVRDVSISLCQDASSVEIMTSKLHAAF